MTLFGFTASGQQKGAREMRAIDYFDKGADAFPERTAIIDRGTPYSYRETRAASERIARAMWAGGLRGEERVAIYSPNDARVLLAMLGMWRAGGVWVPVNPRNALDANAQYMNYAGTAWLLYHSSFRQGGAARELGACQIRTGLTPCRGNCTRTSLACWPIGRRSSAGRRQCPLPTTSIYRRCRSLPAG